MLAIFKRLSWFEWVFVGALIFTVWKITSVFETNKALTAQVETVSAEQERTTEKLTAERVSAQITDAVVFEYTFERELKLRDSALIRSDSLEAYFNARDLAYERPQPEKSHVPEPPPTTPKVKVVYRDPQPDPVAIAVLARGMHDTYCRAYRDPHACTPQNTEDGMPATATTNR